MKFVVPICAVLWVTACTSAPAPTRRPALIINASAESRAELLNVVRAALHNAPLLLADDALTKDSVLLIERQSRLDPHGLSANGREVTLPEHFLLSTDGRHCVLTRERTQQHWVLVHAHCKPRD
jgi:hypothetical protein